MKKWIVVLVFCFGIINMQIAQAEGMNTEFIRFHVIANSDSQEDQELKISIRNKILKQLSPLKQLPSKALAKQYLLDHLKILEQMAQKTVLEAGYNYQVKAQFTTSNFPTRKYHNKIVPAGRYLSLKVIIGEGKGANWWCVLYPPLCHGDWVREKRSNYSDNRVEGDTVIPAFTNINCSINSDKNKILNIKQMIDTCRELIKEVYRITKSPKGDLFFCH